MTRGTLIAGGTESGGIPVSLKLRIGVLHQSGVTPIIGRPPELGGVSPSGDYARLRRERAVGRESRLPEHGTARGDAPPRREQRDL